MDISVIRTTDTHRIKDAIRERLPDIIEDGTPLDITDEYVDVERKCWLKLMVDDAIIGFVEFKPYNRSMLEIHPYIYKSMTRYSHQAVSDAIDWVFSYTDYGSIITNIPESKRYATLFARKLGFTKVGAFKRGFNKHDDMIMFQRMRF